MNSLKSTNLRNFGLAFAFVVLGFVALLWLTSGQGQAVAEDETQASSFEISAEDSVDPSTLPPAAKFQFAAMARMITRSEDPDFPAGENWEAHVLDTHLSAVKNAGKFNGRNVWLAEMRFANGRAPVCFFDGRGGSCQPPAGLSRGNLGGARPESCTTWRYTGVVPNGVTEVKFRTEGGDESQAVPVRSNVYTASIPTEDTVATGVDGDGSTVFRAKIPMKFYSSDNGACPG